MATDVPLPSGKGIRNRALGGYGVSTVVVEMLLEIGGFDCQAVQGRWCGSRPIGPKQEYVVAKPQAKAGFIEFRIKGILLKVAHEQVST